MTAAPSLRRPASVLALAGLILAVSGCDLFGQSDPDPLVYPIVISAADPALEAWDDGYMHLYAVSLDGDAVLLESGEYGDSYPAFSPDGRRLAFISSRAGIVDSQGAYVADRRGRGGAALPTSGSGAGGPPSWHPSNGQVAFTTTAAGVYRDILSGAVGEDARELVSEASEDMFPSWSPDGTRLVFSSNRVRPQEGRGGRAELYVLDAESGDIRQITFRGQRSVLPQWSPDGDEIAYLVRDPRLRTIEDEGPWIYSVATGASTRLVVPLPEGERLVGPVQWLPGGDQLLVLSSTDGSEPPFRRTLYRYDRVRDVADPILRVREVIGFDWNPAVPAP